MALSYGEKSFVGQVHGYLQIQSYKFFSQMYLGVPVNNKTVIFFHIRFLQCLKVVTSRLVSLFTIVEHLIDGHIATVANLTPKR